MSTSTWLVVLSFLAAVVVFCVIQDRITALGAQQYATAQRAAIAGSAPPVAIDDVMAPAVRRAVRQGLLWGGVTLAVGLTAAAALRAPRE